MRMRGARSAARGKIERRRVEEIETMRRREARRRRRRVRSLIRIREAEMGKVGFLFSILIKFWFFVEKIRFFF